LPASCRTFTNPRVSGEYHGLADLGALASLLRQPQVRTGTAQFAGKGSWSIQTFSTEGNVQGKEIEWSNGRVLLRNGRISASFSVTPDRLRVSSIKANLFGGDVRGDADVTNWKDSAEPSPVRRQRAAGGRVAAESLQRGSVRLQLAGFPLLPATEMLSSVKLPLDRLALAGSASGNVETVWWDRSAMRTCD